MKTLLSSLAIFIALHLTPSGASALDRRTEFEIAFLARNFSAIRIPHSQATMAGDILSHRNGILGTLENRISNCLTDFRQRYSRSPVHFTSSSIHATRSINLSAELASKFGLSGELGLDFSSNIDFSSSNDHSEFSVQSDNIRVEADLADSIISRDWMCRVYSDVYKYSSFPYDSIVVKNAYFFSGVVNHNYSIKLIGSGVSRVKVTSISDLLMKLPLLSNMKDFFDLNLSLAVNGEAVNSSAIRHHYPQESIHAVGVFPFGITTSAAAELTSYVQALIVNSVDLDEASLTEENARLFLDNYPTLDLSADNSLLRKIFGKEQEPYRNWQTRSPDRVRIFADIASRIYHINSVAGRMSDDNGQ